MIQKISHSILSLYCQTNFKSNELNQLLKTFDNTNQIGAANFTSTNLKDALSQGRFWISTEECDGIFKFMDPMGTGKMGIKPFIELFNNEFLYAYTVKATVNNTVLLYAIFEGLELQVTDIQNKITLQFRKPEFKEPVSPKKKSTEQKQLNKTKVKGSLIQHYSNFENL